LSTWSLVACAWCFLDLLRVSSFCSATSHNFSILLCSYHLTLLSAQQRIRLPYSANSQPSLLPPSLLNPSNSTSKSYTMSDISGQNTSYPNLDQSGSTQSSNTASANAASFKDSVLNSKVRTHASHVFAFVKAPAFLEHQKEHVRAIATTTSCLYITRTSTNVTL